MEINKNEKELLKTILHILELGKWHDTAIKLEKLIKKAKMI